jgi:hypothetical protein
MGAVLVCATALAINEVRCGFGGSCPDLSSWVFVLLGGGLVASAAVVWSMVRRSFRQPPDPGDAD